jgi:hypothetical protein
MPLRLTTLPSNISDGTPKIHFLGLSFHLVLVKSHENLLEIIDQGMGLPGFYNHIINVGFDMVILYLVSKTVLDGTLVCSPRVLEPERIVM